VGHNLQPLTVDIHTVRTTHPTGRYPVLFVDTPGFDSVDISDVEILNMIAAFLMKTWVGCFERWASVLMT
jgi:hypothetical protein